jgi:two-component system, NtrC family, sensor kinase
MSTLENRRILLVDDTASIHEDFRKILAGGGAASDLAADEALLFGEKASTGGRARKPRKKSAPR